jgi:hypothetical protein
MRPFQAYVGASLTYPGAHVVGFDKEGKERTEKATHDVMPDYARKPIR